MTTDELRALLRECRFAIEQVDGAFSKNWCIDWDDLSAVLPKIEIGRAHV